MNKIIYSVPAAIAVAGISLGAAACGGSSPATNGMTNNPPASNGGGSGSGQGTHSGGSSTASSYACYATDSYGSIEAAGLSNISQSACDSFMHDLGVVYEGQPPGGVSSLDVVCAMSDLNTNQNPAVWVVDVTSDAPSNLCSLLAQNGYTQTGP